MKRFLFLLVAIQIAFVSFGQNDKSVIILKVISTDADETVMNEIEQAGAIIQIEAFFQKALKEEYTLRLVDPDSESAFALFRNTELKNNRVFRDYDIDTPRRSRLKVADYLCLVEISKNNNGEYIFAAKIGNTEAAELIESASYPKIGNTPIKSLDIESLQRACRYLISELGLGEKTVKEESEDEKKTKNEANLKAAGASLVVPGLGLVLKGHNEGYAYLGAEAALCLGGVMVPELMRKSYINKMNHESNAHNKDVYTTRANSCRKVSIICGACAGVLHVVNIVHSFMAKPNRYKNPKLRWDVAAIPVDNGFSNDYAMGLSLSYRF